MIKKLIVLSILLLFVATPVLAYSYSAAVAVIESDGSDYTMLPIIVSVNNTYLADNGYTSSTGLDTRVLRASAERPHMLTNDKLLFCANISADAQTAFDYTFGNSALESFPLIVGYNGSATVPDNVTLKLRDNFTIEMSGYVNTSAGDNKTLIHKPGAFKTYIDGDGNITSLFVNTTIDWTTPTSGPANAIDDNTTTYVEADINPGQWSSWWTFNHTAIDRCAGVQYWHTRENSQIEKIDIEMYYNGSYHTVYNGTCGSGGNWAEKYLDSGHSVNSTRARFYNKGGSQYWVRLHEIDFQGSKPEVTAANLASGDYTIKTIADGTNLSIWINGTEEDSIALNGTSVPNNTYNWTLLENNVMPYMKYCNVTVGNVQTVWYQPNTMISGTVLPNRDTLDWVSPTGHEDSSNNWTAGGPPGHLPEQAYDDDTDTYATCWEVPADSWSAPLNFTCTDSVPYNKLRFYATYIENLQNSVDLDAYYNDTWHDVYQGAYANEEWVEKSLGGIYQVDEVAIRFYNDLGTSNVMNLYEFDFGVPAAPDGAIAWGSNPDGIATSIGGLESSAVTGAATTEEPGAPDYVSPTPAEDLFTESEGANIPLFYPIFKATSDVTGWPIQVFWITGALVLSMLIGVLAMMYLRSQLIAGFASGVAIVVFCSMSNGLIPWWTLYVYAIMAITFIVWQRVASV